VKGAQNPRPEFIYRNMRLVHHNFHHSSHSSYIASGYNCLVALGERAKLLFYIGKFGFSYIFCRGSHVHLYSVFTFYVQYIRSLLCSFLLVTLRLASFRMSLSTSCMRAAWDRKYPSLHQPKTCLLSLATIPYIETSSENSQL